MSLAPVSLAAYTAFNASYTFLEHKRLSSPSLHATLEKVKLYFQVIKGALLFPLVTGLIVISFVAFPLLLTTLWPSIPELVLLCGIIVGSVAGLFFSFLFDEYVIKKILSYTSNLFKPPVKEDSQINWSDSPSKTTRQYFALAEIVNNIALAFLTPYALIFASNAVMNLGCFFFASMQKDLLVSRNYIPQALDPTNGPQDYLVNLHLTCIKSPQIREDDGCPICLEQDEVPEVQFCDQNHSFHAKCLPEYLNTTLRDNLLANVPIQRDVHIIRNSNGGTSTEVHYTITLPQTSLPTCPLCRQPSLSTSLEIIVRDIYRGVTRGVSANVVYV